MKWGQLQTLKCPAQLSPQSQMEPVAVFRILIFNRNKGHFQPPYTWLPATHPSSSVLSTPPIHVSMAHSITQVPPEYIR